MSLTMESTLKTFELPHLLFAILLVPVLVFLLYRFVSWAKKMSKGALFFLALMPLISIFPIPPPVFKNVEAAKQQQKKDKENSGPPKE